MADYRDLPPISPEEMAQVTKPEKWSQSIVAKWDTCHRSAYLYRKYRGGPQSHAMIRGSVFHQFVEETVHYLRDADEFQMPGEVAKDRIMAIPDMRLLPEYEQDALRLMAYNWAEATAIDPRRILDVEMMLELDLGGYVIRGKLDFAQINVAGYAEVKDYKTSLSMPSRDEVERGAKGFQLKFYAALMLFGRPEGEAHKLGEGINEVRAELVFPRYTNPDTGELLGREVVFSRSDLTDFLTTLRGHCEGLDEAFETGRFQAVDGDHCGECPARRECPLPAHLRSFEPIETREQAIEVAKLIDFRDADQRRDRKALKAWIENSGESPFAYNDDHAYEFKAEVKRSVPWGEVGDGPILPEQIKVTKATPLRRRKRTADEKEAA